jgi:predicted dehydrogenase
MTTRREFLRQSAALAAAGLAIPRTINALGHSTIAKPSASDQGRVALIGCKSMGWYDLTDIMKSDNVKCIALCDIDSKILSDRAAEAEKNWGYRVDTYKDYRRLLERSDLDAVIIGTPDHWHCLIMTDACSAGKDVYVEKPIANSISECDAMVLAAKRYNRVVQVGQQQRSSKLWQQMKSIIDSGQLGTIARVNVWANFRYAAVLNPAKDGPVPEGVDFQMWLGPAPDRTFNRSRFHGSWRMFWDYGGGLLTDWGVHLLDMALWGMNVKGMPRRIMASGANNAYPDNFAETFDTMQVIYEFDKFNIQWSNVTIESGPYGKNYGLEFKGTDGTLVVNRESMELYPQDKSKEMQSWKPMNNEHADHARDFVDSVRERRFDTTCPISNGSFCAKYAHMGNIAARTRETLVYDDKQHTFHNKQADRFIEKAYRKPWKMPKWK